MIQLVNLQTFYIFHSDLYYCFDLPLKRLTDSIETKKKKIQKKNPRSVPLLRTTVSLFFGVNIYSRVCFSVRRHFPEITKALSCYYE